MVHGERTMQFLRMTSQPYASPYHSAYRTWNSYGLLSSAWTRMLDAPMTPGSVGSVETDTSSERKSQGLLMISRRRFLGQVSAAPAHAYTNKAHAEVLGPLSSILQNQTLSGAVTPLWKSYCRKALSEPHQNPGIRILRRHRRRRKIRSTAEVGHWFVRHLENKPATRSHVLMPKPDPVITGAIQGNALDILVGSR